MSQTVKFKNCEVIVKYQCSKCDSIDLSIPVTIKDDGLFLTCHNCGYESKNSKHDFKIDKHSGNLTYFGPIIY